MRSRTFVLAAVLLVVSAAAVSAAGISVGARVGLMETKISQAPESWDDALGFRAGFTGGAFMKYDINDRFGIQPEIFYVQKGVDATLYEGLVDVGATLSIDYLEIPLLAVYSFTQVPHVTPYIYAGPSFSYVLSSELSASAFILSADIDFSSFTHTTDFSIIAGGGFEIPADALTLLFDVRFMYGFTNVIMSGDFEIDGSTQTIDEDDFKNYGFAFTAGVGFSL